MEKFKVGEKVLIRSAAYYQYDCGTVTHITGSKTCPYIVRGLHHKVMHIRADEIFKLTITKIPEYFNEI